MKNVSSIAFILSILILVSCNSGSSDQNSSSEQQNQVVAVPGPEAIIYKTTANFNNMVPIIMNAEKTEIASFPAPGDLKYKGKIALPTVLESGFLLDNRGINENAVFLNITYEEYMALDKAPSKEELYNLIIDRNPFIIMYSCGKRQQFNNETEELNAAILKNNFDGFKQLK